MSANWNSSSSSSSSMSSRSTPGRSSPGRSSPSSNANNSSGQVSCAICSDRYKAADNIYAGSCGHVFHWDCLQSWWEQSKSCPICRSTNADYFQIYLDFDETTPCRDQGNSNSCSSEKEKQHKNLIYEAELYRDEIEYLNTHIRHLKLQCEVFAAVFEDSD